MDVLALERFKLFSGVSFELGNVKQRFSDHVAGVHMPLKIDCN